MCWVLKVRLLFFFSVASFILGSLYVSFFFICFDQVYSRSFYFLIWVGQSDVIECKKNYSSLKCHQSTFQKTKSYPGFEVYYLLIFTWTILRNQPCSWGHMSLFLSEKVNQKEEEYPGTRLTLKKQDVFIETRPSQMIGDICKYVKM